jgi:hypothetical protein
MVQLFRDKTADAFQRKGLPGLLALWGRVLLDLIITLVEEHHHESLRLPKESLTRWAGPLLMLVGSLFMAGSVSQLQPGSHYQFYGLYMLSFMSILPALALVGIGLAGLYAWLRPQLNRLGQGGLLLAMAGLPVALVGSIGLVLVDPFVTISLGEAVWGAFIIGFLAHLVGMFLFGIATLRRSFLPRWNFLPLAISLMPFSIFLTANYEDTSGPLYKDFAGILLIGLCWLLMGHALHTEISQEEASGSRDR